MRGKYRHREKGREIVNLDWIPACAGMTKKIKDKTLGKSNILQFGMRGGVQMSGLWWRKRLTFKRDEEVGGILLGTADDYRKGKFEVKLILQVRNGAKRGLRSMRYKPARTAFIGMLKGLWHLFINQDWVVLGEWHSHLQGSFEPSATDNIAMTKRVEAIGKLRGMMEKYNIRRKFTGKFWLMGIANKDKQMFMYKYE